MKVPDRLPNAPERYEASWGAELIRALDLYFRSWMGPLVLVGRLVTRKGRVRAYREVTAATDAMTKDDDIVGVNRAGAVAVTLPAGPDEGQEHLIQDESGGASSATITITPASGDVNGTTSVTITADYGALEFYYNGSQWMAH